MRQTSTGLPPGPTAPKVVQLARWIGWPVHFLESCRARYGDVFTLKLPGSAPFVIFSHPDAVKEIFTADPEELRAGEANAILEPVLGQGSLLLLDGQRHLRERRLMMPPFHGDRMRAYGETMRQTTARAMSRWAPGTPIGILHEMQEITLDVILKTVFGLSEGSKMERMRTQLVRYTALGSTTLGTTMLFAFRPGIGRKLAELGVEPLKIGKLQLDVSRFMPWREIARAGKDVDDMLRAEFTTRRAEGTTDRDDVLSLLMSARDEAGQPMTDDELRDELITLLLAGHETSATTLAWAVHHLLTYPDILAKVQEELRTVGPMGPYLDAVIKETLRLTPIIPMVARRTAVPRTVGGQALPAGVNVMACIYLTHRRPDVWPDPLRFHPDRFVGQKVDPYAYFPFGGGTRRCLGMAFSTYEMKMVLAEIFANARLRFAEHKPVRAVRRGITLTPSGGVQVLRD
jgi:cytochrome P450 family 110